jgi:hypothetical protein
MPRWNADKWKRHKVGYFGEIGHLYGIKTDGCPVKSATPI